VIEDHRLHSRETEAENQEEEVVAVGNKMTKEAIPTGRRIKTTPQKVQIKIRRHQLLRIKHRNQSLRKEEKRKLRYQISLKNKSNKRHQ
jgi:hypothetical protein